MNTPDQPDPCLESYRAILRLYSEGDDSGAFRFLAQEFHTLVSKRARRLLARSPQLRTQYEPNEMVNDGLLRLHGRLIKDNKALPLPEELKTWVFNNLAWEHRDRARQSYHKCRREVHRSPIQGDDVAEWSDPLYDVAQDPDISLPEVLIQQSRDVQRIKKCLGALTERHRDIVLSMARGEPQRTIAERLGYTSAQAISRAGQMAREAIKRCFDAPLNSKVRVEPEKE